MRYSSYFTLRYDISWGDIWNLLPELWSFPTVNKLDNRRMDVCQEKDGADNKQGYKLNTTQTYDSFFFFFPETL
jgi:hypothetical protein